MLRISNSCRVNWSTESEAVTSLGMVFQERCCRAAVALFGGNPRFEENGPESQQPQQILVLCFGDCLGRRRQATHPWHPASSLSHSKGCRLWGNHNKLARLPDSA